MRVVEADLFAPMQWRCGRILLDMRGSQSSEQEETSKEQQWKTGTAKRKRCQICFESCPLTLLSSGILAPAFSFFGASQMIFGPTNWLFQNSGIRSPERLSSILPG